MQDKTITSNSIRIVEDMFFEIIEDKKGSIWVGTLGAVFRYDGKLFNHFEDPNVKE